MTEAEYLHVQRMTQIKIAMDCLRETCDEGLNRIYCDLWNIWNEALKNTEFKEAAEALKEKA